MGVMSHVTIVVTTGAEAKLKGIGEVNELLTAASDREESGDQVLYYFEHIKAYQECEGNEFHTILNTLDESQYLMTKVVLDNGLEYGYEPEEFGKLESNWEVDVDAVVTLTY